MSDEIRKPISAWKLLLVRAVDAALIAALVLGSEDAKTFAFWIVSIMVAILFLGAFTLTKSAAIGMSNGSLVRKAGLVIVQVAYVLSLVYAGFPVLAALYTVAAVLMHLCIDSKSKESAAA